MTEQQTPTSEVLNKAADLIEERGWIVGPGGWPDDTVTPSPLCLEGGLLAAQGLTDLDATVRQYEFVTCSAYVAVMDFLSTDSRWGRYSERAYNWNDAEGRTQAEVIEVLRAAAAIEAAREAEPLDANGRGTGECELTAERVAS